MPRSNSNVVDGSALEAEKDAEFITAAQAREILEYRKRDKVDHLSMLKDTKFSFDSDKNPTLQINNTSYTMSNFALSGLERIFKMSPGYFRKVPEEFTKKHMDFHIEQNADQRVLFKTLGTSIAGVLKDDENNIDNLELFNTMADENVFDIMNIQIFKGSRFHLAVRATHPDMISFGGEKDPWNMGLYFRNDELRPKVFDLGKLVFRQVCSNGAIRTVANTVAGFERGFKVFSLKDLKRKIKPAIKTILEEANLVSRKLTDMRGETWSALDWNQIRKKLLKSDIPVVVKKFFTEESEEPIVPANVFDLVDKLTNISQKKSQSARFQIDTFAGKLIYDGLGAFVD